MTFFFGASWLAPLTSFSAHFFTLLVLSEIRGSVPGGWRRRSLTLATKKSKNYSGHQWTTDCTNGEWLLPQPQPEMLHACPLNVVQVLFFLRSRLLELSIKPWLLRWECCQMHFRTFGLRAIMYKCHLFCVGFGLMKWTRWMASLSNRKIEEHNAGTQSESSSERSNVESSDEFENYPGRFQKPIQN